MRHILTLRPAPYRQRTTTFLNFKDSISKIKIQEGDYTPS